MKFLTILVISLSLVGCKVDQNNSNNSDLSSSKEALEKKAKEDKDKEDKKSKKDDTEEDEDDTEVALSNDWRDYRKEFDCGMSYTGQTNNFPEAYTRIDQPIYVTEPDMVAVITSYQYPSGQSIEVREDNNGFPSTLIGTATTKQYYDRTSDSGSECCSDRTFVYFFSKRLTVVRGMKYHFIIKPNVPSEYTTVLRSNIPNNCVPSEQINCETSSGWVACGGTTGNAPDKFVQDILY